MTVGVTTSDTLNILGISLGMIFLENLPRNV